MDKRKHPRHPVMVYIKICHEDFGEKLVKTRNVSDGGVFLVADPSDLPDPGAIVQGQVQGMMEDAPILDMEIVRVEADGIGLRYIFQ